MAITGMTNMSAMINPEVMGDMIEAKIAALLKITPYAKVDTTLQGVAGDTKTVPAWNYIGDATDIAEGEEVSLTAMSASTRTFTIKKAMKAVGLTQEALNSGLGNPLGQAETQLAKSIAGKVDEDVLNAILSSTNVYDGTAAVIGYDGIVEANGKFEDEEDGIDRVMFIHPKQETQLLKDPDFLSADKFQSGVAVNGAIGKIAGCWIKKSAKVPAVAAVTAVAGVYTVTIGGTVASGDHITVHGTQITLDGTSGASAIAAATAMATELGSDAIYTVNRTGAVLTLTEKTGKEGTGAPTATITSTAGTIAVATTTAGVAAFAAHYKCPIIKTQPDDPQTEFTESELPAVTIFLKKDTQTDHQWMPRTQTHEVTTAKYYGVALTNSAKVVIAKFKQA